MSEPLGASPVGDRAVGPSDPSPSVSAVPASIPGATLAERLRYWADKMEDGVVVGLWPIGSSPDCAAPDMRFAANEIESRGDLVEALVEALSAMDMQEKRMAGSFHIPSPTASRIWSAAKANARRAIDLARGARHE